MIIWGSRGREINVSSGEFNCPSCNARRQYKRKRVAKYFTLYFIPLFQTENLGEYIECQTCGKTFKPSVLTYEPPTPLQQLALNVRRELETGMPLHMIQKKLIASGVGEQNAAQLIELATTGDQVTCPTCGFKYLGTLEACANCGTKFNLVDRTIASVAYSSAQRDPLPLPPEVQSLLGELRSDSAKRRWSTIKKLAQLQVDHEAVVAALVELEEHDPVPYVRVEAQAALETPRYQEILRRIRSWPG